MSCVEASCEDVSIGENGGIDESDRLDEPAGSGELDESDRLDRLDGLDESDGLDELTTGGIMSSGVLVDVVDAVVYVLSSGIFYLYYMLA